MKFYNTITQINQNNRDYILIDNNTEKSALIITIQIINKEQNDITVVFKRKDSEGNYTPYVSQITLKPGTTILDHLNVIQPKTKYLASSNSTETVISCSYGI